MKWTESPVAGMFEDGGGKLLEGKHKDVVITLAVGDEWVSIYSIESDNPGHGEAQEAIQEIRKDFPTMELWGSTPLNDTIGHIFDKLGVRTE